MSFRLQVRNYRGLRAIDWSPEGVCALVGANGSGKTTPLDVPALLGDAIDRGLAHALEAHGGIANARNMYADEQEPYHFEITLDDVTWRLAPVLTGDGFRPEEKVTVNDRIVISREAGSNRAKIFGSLEKVGDELAFAAGIKHPWAGDSADAQPKSRLPELLSRYRLHGSYDLAALRRSGSPDSGTRRLDRRGTNVFSVLRNWRDKKQDRAAVPAADALDHEQLPQLPRADLGWNLGRQARCGYRGHARAARRSRFRIAVDDLELATVATVATAHHVTQLVADAFRRKLGNTPTHNQLARVRERCSFHLLCPMLET